MWVCDKEGQVMQHHSFAAHPSDYNNERVASCVWAPDSSAVALETGDPACMVQLGCAPDTKVLPDVVSAACWAPHVKGCGHPLLLQAGSRLWCMTRVGQRCTTTSLLRLSAVPSHLACGISHLAVVLGDCAVQLLSMQAGLSMQLVAEVCLSRVHGVPVHVDSLCFNPTGRYCGVFSTWHSGTASMLDVISTCSGKALAVRSLPDGDHASWDLCWQ